MGTKNEPIQCTKCFTINPEDSEYCTRCGTPLEEKDETISYSPDYDISKRDAPRFNPGDNFGHRFRIIEEIGRGGMGRVYKAKDHQLSITVALKVIRPKFSSDKLFIKRLIKETLIARSISHENVIRIHDIGEIENIKYISMDYISGENLKELMRTSGKLTIETAVKISKHICESLKAAHKKGIIHRDLKPQNIMVDKNGIAYTMDFGLARAVKSRDRMIPGAIYGTPQYTSPEQARGDEADERSDIYSLGTIMHEMLTGEPLVKGKTKEECLKSHIKDIPIPSSKINPRIPQSLDSIILKCLEKERNKRYQNIDEVLKDLNSYVRIADPASVLSKRRKWTMTTAVAVFVVLIGLFVAIKLGWFRSPPTLSEEKRISIAVMYFENNTGVEQLDYYRTTVASLITYDLLQSKYIRPITADRLLEIHENLGLDIHTAYSRDDLEKIAAMAGIDHIMLGNIYKIGENFRINTRIHDVKTWDLIGTPMIEGSNITSLVDNLAMRIKSVFHLSKNAIAVDIDENIAKITTESTEALNHYFEGIKLYTENKLEQSNEVLEKAVKLDPEFAMAYKQMSVNYSYIGNSQQTRQYLETALTLLDRVSLREKYLIRGYNAIVMKNSPQEAIENFQELLTLYPDDVDGLVHLGSVYRNTEEWDLALEQFEKVLRIDNQHAIANQNLCFFYKAKGLYDKAIDLLNKRKAFFPNESEIHRELSLIYIIQHKSELAIEHAEQALSFDCTNSLNILNMGTILLLTGDLDEAQSYGQLLLTKDSQEDTKIDGAVFQFYTHLLQGAYRQCQANVQEIFQLIQTSNGETSEIFTLLIKAYLDLRMNQISNALTAANSAEEKAKKNEAAPRAKARGFGPLA